MSDTPRTSLLPDCMMPDGADPCLAYQELDAQLMRWFRAASPYATPSSLEEGLKDAERFQILARYMLAIIWKKEANLPDLGTLEDGFHIDELRAWCDGAKK